MVDARSTEAGGRAGQRSAQAWEQGSLTVASSAHAPAVCLTARSSNFPISTLRQAYSTLPLSRNRDLLCKNIDCCEGCPRDKGVITVSWMARLPLRLSPLRQEDRSLPHSCHLWIRPRGWPGAGLKNVTGMYTNRGDHLTEVAGWLSGCYCCERASHPEELVWEDRFQFQRLNETKHKGQQLARSFR